MRCVLAICAIFKDEAAYLREWVEFHQLMGVERFYLYNNGSTDRYLDALDTHIAAGTVVLHEWPAPGAQLKVYEHCLKTYGNDADWIGFLDIDEFLFSPNSRLLPDVLADYADHPAVGVNWLMFGSSGHVDKPKGGVLENFLKRGQLESGLTYPALRKADGSFHSENAHIKSIVQPSRVSTCETPHHFTYTDNGHAVDERKNAIHGPLSNQVSVSVLRINHYWSKSEQECRHKFARGYADGTGARDWREFLAHEQILNEVHDDTALRVVATLAMQPSQWALDDFERDDEGVWHSPLRSRPVHHALHRTAGRLFERVSEAADTSTFSPELAEEIQGRDSALALSPRRANVLQLLSDLPAGSRVLELGAHAGALTQAMLERGWLVDAVEFSPHWARVAAARVRHAERARVFQASLRELTLSADYDAVFVHFTDHYSEAFPRGDALNETLRIAASALKPDGRLLLSSGNRMAKPGRDELPTLAELKRALGAAGLPAIETNLLFPYPALPEVIVHADALAQAPQWRVDDVLAQRPLIRDGGAEASHWQRHYEADTLTQHAPGFVLIARHAGQPATLAAERLAMSFADDRVPALDTVTDYLLDEAGAVIARPRSLQPGTLWHSSAFEQSLAPYRVDQHRSLLAAMRTAIHAKRSDLLIDLLRRWGALVSAQANEEERIPGAWLYALPAQIGIDAAGDLHFHGGEWIAPAPIEKQIPIYLGLWQLAYEGGMEALTGLANARDRVVWLCKRLLLDASAEWIGHGRQINEAMAREIHGGDRWNRSDRHQKIVPEWLVAPPISNLYKQWLANQQLDELAVQDALARIEQLGAPLRVQVMLLDPLNDSDAVERTRVSLAAQHLPAAEINVISGSEDLFARLNQQLSGSDADWVQLVYAGDLLHPAALLVLAERVAMHPYLRAVYADEDSVVEGEREAPIFKPDLNLDMLRSYPYIGRSLAVQRARCLAVGGFAASYGEMAGYDLLFRLIETDGLQAVGHVAEVLYHAAFSYSRWLASETVATHSAQIVSTHLVRMGIAHRMDPGTLPGFNRVVYLHARKPLVSVIIPTKDQLPLINGLLDSLLAKTTYPNYELLIVDNNTSEPAACAFLDGIERLNSPQLRVLRYPHPFNYSTINNFAAAQARGEYLILLNNDTAVLHGDWIEAMLNHAQRPEVGIVGAKLHYPDGRIQHGGVVLGLRGPADHPFIGQPMEADGYMHRLRVDQNYTAVTAACLMIRKSVYEEVGGLDDEAFKVSYNDVDLCLKVNRAGYLTVWTPYARLMHVGSVSQSKVDTTAQAAKQARFEGEQAAMYTKWMPQLIRDPAYNLNFSIDGTGFELNPLRARAWQPFAQPLRPRMFCVAADAHGCGHYRIRQPFASMLREGLVEGMLADVHLPPIAMERFEPTSLILQRQITDAQINRLESYRDFSRAFKVFELDDLLHQVPVKSMFHEMMPKDLVKSLRRSLSTVDRFVVSTEPLAEHFKGFHGEIRVVHNRLPTDWWAGLQNARRVGRKPRVGWGGGSSHRGDLELIAEVVRELSTEVEWVFFGMCPEKLRPYVHEFHPGVPIEEYPRKLASLNLDLALAPLEENPFNQCKSNLRLLEYGACGFPVICTDIEAYQGDLPVTRVRNRHKEWVDAIRAHVADLDATAKQGDALRDTVLNDWMLQGEALREWRDAWLPG